MINRWLIGIAPLALALMQFGCSDAPKAAADTRVADEKAIRELEAQWVKDFAAKDLDKDMSHYTDDASFLLTDMPIVNGRDAIRGIHKGMLADPAWTVNFSAAKVEVAKSGDLAYSQGAYTMTSTNPKTKKTATEKGKYITVFKKQPDGAWKAQQDMLNADGPAMSEKTGKVAKTMPAAKMAKKGRKAKR
jgi:uncharacterized protein (TIGR02246 family)